jgi:hypothetical protein
VLNALWADLVKRVGRVQHRVAVPATTAWAYVAAPVGVGAECRIQKAAALSEQQQHTREGWPEWFLGAGEVKPPGGHVVQATGTETEWGHGGGRRLPVKGFLP